MSSRTKVILFLAVLGLADVVIPVPVVAAVAIYVAATRPPWFTDLVERVYRA